MWGVWPWLRDRNRLPVAARCSGKLARVGCSLVAVYGECGILGEGEIISMETLLVLG